jgi:cullin 3
LAQFASECGEEYVSEYDKTRDAIVFTQHTLKLKEMFDSILDQCFAGGKFCKKKIEEAFDSFLNNGGRGATIISNYVDDLLRNGIRNLTSHEADQKIDSIVSLFRHIDDKDIFESCYRYSLAKRLLNGKTASDDAERSMISKFKAECGYQYASKLEGMFTDMKISGDTMEAFRKSDYYLDAEREALVGAGAGGCPEVSVEVLTMGYWPMAPVPTCILPPGLKPMCDKYEVFYHSRHGGRKLCWLTSHGSASVKATFPSGKHDLNVSTYQMCMLVLFNKHDRITLELIRQKCRIPEADMRRHLLSLCTSKLKILERTSKGKFIEDDDSFIVNAKFASKLRRLKVPLIMESEDAKDVNAKHELVEEDRRLLIDSACVRIMKARRTLSLTELIGEVSHQLSQRFSPNPQVVKKRIESLIEREFLDRDKTDHRIFHYIA